MVPPLVHSVGELEQSVYNINSNTGTGIRTEWFYKISIAIHAQASEQNVLQYQ